MATWKELLTHEQQQQKDETSFIHVSPSEEVLTVEFDDGYGTEEGPDFLAWTETRVYFPVCYDGSEYVGSAPRNPVPEGQSHVGSYKPTTRNR